MGDHIEAKDHAVVQLELARGMRGVGKSTIDDEFDALRAVGVAALAGGLALGRNEESDDPETVATWLAESLTNFEELAKVAETHANSLVAARAWRDVMKVHRALRNDLQSLHAYSARLLLCLTGIVWCSRNAIMIPACYCLEAQHA
jgi:hypothetical protein